MPINSYFDFTMVFSIICMHILGDFAIIGANKRKGVYYMNCPKCGSPNVSFQRENVGNVGAYTNKVYVEPAKKRHSVFWYMTIILPMFSLMWNLSICLILRLFKPRRRGGLGFHASKNKNRTVGVCQSCGYTWKA